MHYQTQRKVSSTRRLLASAQGSRSCAARAAAAIDTKPVTGWDAVQESAGSDVLEGFYLRPDSKPATSPTKPLTPSPNPQSDKPVVLFRDTNAWCPYCQMVWMALLEKEIPFDTVLINLMNKPDWYSQVTETKLTPAVRIKQGSEEKIMGESRDIMHVRTGA